MDNAYVLLDRSMKPLPGYSARLIGPLVMTGEPRPPGRSAPGAESQRGHAAGEGPEVRRQGEAGRFVAADDGSSLPGLLDSLSASDRREGVEVHAGATGILVQRKGGLQAWLCDFWLAERLAQQT